MVTQIYGIFKEGNNLIYVLPTLISNAYFSLIAPFRCPEDNGFFPDPEQCDLYYECIDNIPEAKLCPDGLLFEDGNPNQEKCDYPFNVECGDREYVRK